MGFWSWLNGVNHEGEIANANPASSVGPGYNPGDPEGVVLEEPDTEVEARSLPAFYPSPWSGWPSTWSTPNWDFGSRFNELVDVAWTCLDKNASVLSSLPVYRTRGGHILEPSTWMVNPDPSIYSSWQEFAKQLFWDFQLGEAFVMEMSHFSDGFPMRFRVMPPWTMHVEMVDGTRRYRIGGSSGPDVTDQILHIRYKSTSADAHGTGPLASAGGRMLTAGLIAKYVREVVETGGVPVRTIETDADLEPEEAQDLMNQYMASRVQNASAPPVFDNGGHLVDHPAVSPKDMAMIEIAQFNESRIAVLLGVPPFLVGLPSGGDAMCVDTETEILTLRGWKQYDELILGEDVFTLDHDTGMAEWQPLQDVNTFAVQDRAMVSMEMVGHSSFSTDDHKWPVVTRSEKTGETTRQIKMSRDLKRTDALVLAAPSDVPLAAKYTDAFVELVAWFYTEGTVGPYNAISIAQSDRVNPDHCARIRAAIRGAIGLRGWSEYHYGDMITWRLNRESAAAVLSEMEDARRKVVDRRFLYSLTQAQLELFVRVSVWADGCESNGQTTFKQKDTDRLERFELACILAGIPTMRHGGNEVTLRRRASVNPIQAHRRARRFGRSLVEAVQFTGVVWCPTTSNGTWFARRRGTTYFTHNTYSNVSALFDFHDRQTLRPIASHVMGALSYWTLPRGQGAEINRDEYSRPAFQDRATAWEKLIAAQVVRPEEVRTYERFQGSGAPMSEESSEAAAMIALTGGEA